jgi:hypothetical protein
VASGIGNYDRAAVYSDFRQEELWAIHSKHFFPYASLIFSNQQYLLFANKRFGEKILED